MESIKIQIQIAVLTWMSRNRDKFPRYLLASACAVAAFFFVWVVLTIAHPYAAEIVQNALIRFGLFLNLCLAALAVICAIAFFLWNFGRGVTVSTPDVSGLLGARNWQEPDISPNVLICLLPGETANQFSARMEAAKKTASPSRWVLVIPFRGPKAFVFDSPNDGAVLDMGRNAPLFQNETWTDEQKPYANTYFVYEERVDYYKYVSWFCYYFLEWAEREKISSEETAIGKTQILRNTITSALNILVFLILSLPAFSQDANAVNNVLGKYAGKVPESGAQIEYSFASGKDHFRKGNGRLNYLQLLENVPGFRYPSGQLMYVTKNGEVIAKASAAGDVATDPMRPHQGSAIPPNQVRGFSLPDSNSMADMAEDAKRQIYLLKETAGKAVRPWWDVVIFGMWCLSTVIAVFVCGSFMVAYVTAKEGDYWGHKKARKALMYTLLGLALVLIIQSALYMNAWGFPQFAIILGVGVETAALCWLVTAFVPNFWPSPGNAPARGGAHGYYANDNPRLGA